MYNRQPVRVTPPRRAKDARKPTAIAIDDPSLTWPDENSEEDPDFVPEAEEEESDEESLEALSEEGEEASEEESDAY